jgi:hypothetical protein
VKTIPWMVDHLTRYVGIIIHAFVRDLVDKKFKDLTKDATIIIDSDDEDDQELPANPKVVYFLPGILVSRSSDLHF